MTICIGTIVDNSSSLILATDSMITNDMLSIQFEHPTRKMTCLCDGCVAMTAGDALAYTELFNIVQNEINRLRSPSISDAVEMVKECYQTLRTKIVQERFLKPRGFKDFNDFYDRQRHLMPDIALMIQNQIDNYDYGLEILIAGISNDGAHIYGVTDPGTSYCFDSIGFHAIGSGLPHAINSLIARGCHQDTPLKEALLIVYEAKKLAEKAPGVGNNITNICLMNHNGIIDFSDDKIKKLDNIYKKWLDKEAGWSDELDKLLQEIGGAEK